MPRYGGVELGGWVPQARAQSIGAAGVDPEYYEMMQLNDYALAHPEAQADTMRKYYDAMNRWNAKGSQYQQEARDLTEQAMKNDARQLYNNNPGPGSGGFGLAQQIAGSTLANQSQAILGARLGNLMMPAGNALETLDGMGLNVSDGLRRYASTGDALSQFAYNPDNVFSAKSFGFGYKSDGIGGNDFGPVAWGGDGRQYAREIEQNYRRDAANDSFANRRYNEQMNNRNPLGGYKGPSEEYLSNIKSWSKQPNNIWIDTKTGGLARMNYDSDGFINSVSDRKGDTYTERQNPDGRYQNWNWIRNNPSQYQGPYQAKPQTQQGVASNPNTDWSGGYDIGRGNAMTNGGAIVPTRAGAGNQGEWDFGARYNPPNPRPFDPTDPRSGYKPELGTQDAFLKSHGKSAYLPPDSLRDYGRYDSQNGTSNQPQVKNTMVGSVEDQEMYGGYNEGALQPMAAFAKAPKLVRQGGPKPFGGSLSPDWTEYGRGYGQLFSRAYQQPRSSHSASSSFDRWQTDPFTAGQIGAFMQQR